MSVHRYETADGTRWRVRWRDEQGRMRSKSWPSRRDALGFDADVKARRFRGEPLPRPGRMTLASAYEDWKRTRGRLKAPATRQSYEESWRAHVQGNFDRYRLSDLVADPELLEMKIADLASAGVGDSAQRKVLTVVSAVLTRCVDNNKIPFNPALRIEWPSPVASRIARPLAPIAVERIRQAILERATKDPSGTRALGDASIVSILAYAGLRPAEALALRFEDAEGRTLAVDKALKWGDKGHPEGTTKTRKTRTPPMVQSLVDDLRELRDVRGGPQVSALIFGADDGSPWSRSAWNNWRSRVWKPAVQAVAAAHPGLSGFGRARPYDLRGSFVSLQLRSNKAPLEVADWAGHSPVVMFRHYAKVIRELEGEPALPADEQIQRARELVKRPPDEVADLVAEAQKPPEEAANLAYRLLYGERIKVSR